MSSQSIYPPDHGQVAIEVRSCTCHPDDNPPRPCPQKYALTHCRAASLAGSLRHAVTTASNDDLTEAGTEKRQRHIERVDVMIAAAEFLEERY